MVMVFIFMIINKKIFMKEIGLKESKKEKENLLFQMEKNIKEFLKMEKS